MKREYIHVITNTKRPEIRTGKTPFEFHNRDPNKSSAFGPNRRSMFIPVTREPTPSINNNVTEKINIPKTDGVDGEYESPNWIVKRRLVNQDDLQAAKNAHLDALSVDYNDALSSGYVEDSYIFPFSEEFLNGIQTRSSWMTSAQTNNDIPRTFKITFSDKNNKEVQRTATQMKASAIAYGKAYFTIIEKEAHSKDQIEAATTIQELTAVTWKF